MRRELFICVVFLAACARTVTLTPVNDAPAQIPPSLAPELNRALALANDADIEAPPWKILGAHQAAGRLVEHYRLGRGVHLLLAIDHGARAFTHQLWFDVRDLDARAGGALLELYRDRPGGERMRAYDLAGARISAGISRELGFFSATAPSKLGSADPFEAVAKLEADRLAKKEDAAGALARADALADPRERVDRVMVRALRARTEKEPPPELNPGLLIKIAAATLASQRLLLVVAGDVDRARVLTVLRRFHAERGAAAEVETTKPALRTSPPAFAVEVAIPSDDRELLLGWTLDPADDPLPLQALAHVLASGAPSRLAARLGEGIAGIRARAPEGARTLEVTLILEPALTSTRAAQRVRDEIESIAKGDGTARDLERARDRMMREVLQKASGLESRAELFAAALLLDGSVDSVERRLNGLSELSEETLREAVKKSLAGKTPGLVLGVPDKEGP